MTTNFDMIGRDEIDDLEAILSITNSDVDEVVHTVRAEADALFTWDYERSRPALVKLYEKAKTSQWNAETDLDWSIEVDQAAVVLANQAQMGSHVRRDDRPQGHGLRDLDRGRLDPARDRVAELEPEPVHARRAGRADLHRADRRDRPVDRRQVLRGDAGDGRGPPRGGLRQVPRHEALGPLPDQRAPRDAPRRHHLGLALGHDLPRHADHGRGPRARGVRLHAPDDHRAAAQEAAPLRDERRGAPRRVRRALAAGVLRPAHRRGDPRAPGVRVRGRGAHARPVPPAGGLGADGRRRQGGAVAGAPGRRPQDVPERPLLQDRAELQEARSARRRRRLAARALHRARRDPVRGLGGHRRGVRRARRGRRRPRRRRPDGPSTRVRGLGPRDSRGPVRVRECQTSAP